MSLTIIVLIAILFTAGILIFFFLRPTPEEQLPLCTFNPDDYPRIETFQKCPNSQRYFDPVNNRTIAVMSRDIAPLASQVCGEWCSQLQLPNSCISQSQGYAECLTELQSSGCISRALPVATTGNEYAFVIGRGNLC